MTTKPEDAALLACARCGDRVAALAGEGVCETCLPATLALRSALLARAKLRRLALGALLGAALTPPCVGLAGAWTEASDGIVAAVMGALGGIVAGFLLANLRAERIWERARAAGALGETISPPRFVWSRWFGACILLGGPYGAVLATMAPMPEAPDVDPRLVGLIVGASLGLAVALFGALMQSSVGEAGEP